MIAVSLTARLARLVLPGSIFEAIRTSNEFSIRPAGLGEKLIAKILFELASAVSKHGYTGASNFKVGAAALTRTQLGFYRILTSHNEEGPHKYALHAEHGLFNQMRSGEKILYLVCVVERGRGLIRQHSLVMPCGDCREFITFLRSCPDAQLLMEEKGQRIWRPINKEALLPDNFYSRVSQETAEPPEIRALYAEAKQLMVTIAPDRYSGQKWAVAVRLDDNEVLAMPDWPNEIFLATHGLGAILAGLRKRGIPPQRIKVVAAVHEGTRSDFGCGRCRQEAKVCGPETVFLSMSTATGTIWHSTMAEVLPHSFDMEASR